MQGYEILKREKEMEKEIQRVLSYSNDLLKAIRAANDLILRLMKENERLSDELLELKND